MKVEVLGKNLGQASGWDQVDEWVIHFYDFIPNEFGKKFLNIEGTSKKVGLCIYFIQGIIELYDDTGEKSEKIKVNWNLLMGDINNEGCY